jgi:hypothetical protein
MSYRGGLLTGVVGTLLAGGAVAAGWYLTRPAGESAKPPAPPIPATVPKPFKEDQATAITLTPEGEQRLAIRLGTAERKRVPRHRVYGGEVTVPPGRSVVVSTPLAGVLQPVSGVIPAAGLAVKKGQPLVELLPLLSPGERVNLFKLKAEAEGLEQAAVEKLKAANVTLDTAKRQEKGGAGTRQMVEAAQAAVAIAQKELDAAKANRKVLDDVASEVSAGRTAPIAMDAPQDGVLRGVSALPGQSVPAGAALFEVVNLDAVWVRVPVYVGDLSEIDPGAPAAIGALTARPGSPARPADPVSAPPAANPAAGTADLFFALDNRQTHYRPGERVGATLKLQSAAESLTVPWSAVVFDIHGGTWVYEKTGDRSYTRRRVVVRYVAADAAVLESGPPPGTTVVTAGAAELFGTETGFSK